jgi:hypothetical protein
MRRMPPSSSRCCRNGADRVMHHRRIGQHGVRPVEGSFHNWRVLAGFWLKKSRRESRVIPHIGERRLADARAPGPRAPTSLIRSFIDMAYGKSGV